MRIASVTCHNVDALPDRRFELRSAAVVLITGPPGSGKTTFLEALCCAKEDVGPYGGRPERRLVRPGKPAAKIIVEWKLTETEHHIIGGDFTRVSESIFGAQAGEAGDLDDGLRLLWSRQRPGHPRMEYFHAGRRLPRSSWPGSSQLSTMDRLTTSDNKYQGLNEFLVEATLGVEREGAAARFARLFDALCPSKRFRGAVRAGGAMYAAFSSTDDPERSYTIDELSSSEAQLVLFVGALVRQELQSSILLIDSPELHLPVDIAAALLRTLADHGDNQIIATASPDLASRVEGAVTIAVKGA